jgi:hypothetical protein
MCILIFQISPTGYTTSWSTIRSQYGASNRVCIPSQVCFSSMINSIRTIRLVKHSPKSLCPPELQ